MIKRSLLSYRLLTPVLALLLAVMTSALAAPRLFAAEAINNGKAEIGVMTQEYAGDNIAEILMIKYDGQQPALAPYGYRNPEIESFNNAIKFGIHQRYNEFMDNNHDGRTIEIKSYPFTSQEYLQIVTTSVIHPAYGTDGSIASYNFNKKENRFMALADVMEELRLDESTLTKQVKKLYTPQEPSRSVGEVEATGFLIVQGLSGPLTQLLLEVEIKQDGTESWKHFFAYTPVLNELLQLNRHCLFDPADMDRMEPPLSYRQEQTNSHGILAGSPRLTFNTQGLEVITPGREYLLDGTVYFSVEKMPPVSYDWGKVLAQIQAREGYDIRLITLTPSDEHTKLLSYPVWLVVYDIGRNEDTRHCVDVYVHGDTADYRLHTSVPADLATEYHDEIGKRLATLAISE